MSDFLTLIFFFVIAVCFCFFLLESSKLVAPYGEIKPPDYITGTPCLFLPSWNAMQAGKEKNEG